jgi:hypothetical protein
MMCTSCFGWLLCLCLLLIVRLLTIVRFVPAATGYLKTARFALFQSGACAPGFSSRCYEQKKKRAFMRFGAR